MVEGNVSENQEMISLDVAPIFQRLHDHLKSDTLSIEFDSAYKKIGS
jgi:hypothetical protein